MSFRRPGGPRPGPSGRTPKPERRGKGGNEGETGDPSVEPLELEITDVLDLHTFLPREVPDVVRDWLDAAYEKGYREVRIIHGRGQGVQRRTVRTLLERDPRVVSFEDAPAFSGGWGATVVVLR